MNAANVVRHDLAWIEARSIPEPNTGCWLWLLGIKPQGYGQVTIPRPGRATTSTTAHVVAYVAVHGPVPSDSIVRQACGNRWCVNPAHLRCISRSGARMLVTHSDRGNAKLSLALAEQIRRMFSVSKKRKVRYGMMRAACKKFGVSATTVYRVINGEHWIPGALEREERKANQRHWYGRLDLESRRFRRYPGMTLTKPEEFDADEDRRNEMIEQSDLSLALWLRRGWYEAA